MRLYEYQAASIAAGGRHLTVPESYRPPEHDLHRLRVLGVQLLAIPDDLLLGEAVVYAINHIGGPDQPVTILHGDTLIELADAEGRDVIAIGERADGYSWAEVDLRDGRVLALETVESGAIGAGQRPVACGYFAFSSTALVRAITRVRGQFIAGINLYAAEHRMDALTVATWLDFGHLQTFYRSRRSVTTARSFNTLRIDALTACKSGEDHAKIEAEAAWFVQVPPHVQIYCARVIDQGEVQGAPFYTTEYEYLPTLSEIFVFGATGRQTWMRILMACKAFLESCAACPGVDAGDRGPRRRPSPRPARMRRARRLLLQ